MKKLKNLKTLFILFLSITLSSSFFTNIFANTKINYSVSKNFVYKKNNINATGTYPVIQNLSNKKFEDEINKEILQLIDDYFNQPTTLRAQVSEKKINLKYKTFISKNILSICLYFKNINTYETDVKSIVIDTKKQKKLSIESILGPNATLFANKVLKLKAKEEDLKNAKIYNEKAFYVENEKVYIYCIDENPFIAKDLFTIDLSPKNIKNYVINKNEYHIKSPYSVKMLPLREPLEALGFKILWNEKDQHITISTEDNKLVSYIKPTENKYSKGSFVARSLEFAPEIINGITYVPISFFSDIADLLYSIDENDNITISKILEI